MAASGHEIGAPLSQEGHRGILKLITCTSRKLHPAPHAPLVHSLKKSMSTMQIRCLAYIAMFDIEIAHIPCVKSTAADVMSHTMFLAFAVQDDLMGAYNADKYTKTFFLKMMKTSKTPRRTIMD